MEIIELNTEPLKRVIRRHNSQRKADKPLARNLRWDHESNLLLFLSAMITSNYRIKEVGIVSYESSNRGRKKNLNPYLLCNGKFIYDVEYGDMPILLPTEAYRMLATGSVLETLEDHLKLIERHPIESHLKPYGTQSEHYFLLTAEGKKLLPAPVEFIELNKSQSKKLKDYFRAKNCTKKNEYKRLTNMLPSFEFHVPKEKVFKERHLVECQNFYEFYNLENLGDSESERFKRTPEELLKIIYNQMINFNNTDLDAFIMKCTSDSDRWGARFYALPAYIKSLARNYLRSRETGSYLVELDIRNSQLHMINAVLEENFGNGCTGQFGKDLRNDVDIYIRIAQEAYQTSKSTDEQRVKAKVDGMFSSLFSGTFKPANNASEEKKNLLNAVKKLYPDLVTSVEKLKSVRIPGFQKTLPFYADFHAVGSNEKKKIQRDNDYRKVSFCATCKETEIMKQVWNALYKEKIKYTTAHDAVFVDPKDLDIARSRFDEILKEKLGYLPYVKVKYLCPPRAEDESEDRKSRFLNQRVKQLITQLIRKNSHSKKVA